MLQFELYLLDQIQEIFKNPFFDTIMPLITHLGAMGALPIAIATVLILRKSTRATGMRLALALIICFAIVNLGLKPLVARARPFNYRDIVLLVGIPADFSFPSGHSAIFMAVTSSLFYCKSRTWTWFLLLTFIVGFSRLYLYVHFPSDVIAGFALGWLAGWLSYKLDSKFNDRPESSG